jgi:hypothetical protein
MISRAVVINLHYEGDPNGRFGDETNEETLKNHVRNNRKAILGELYGMVARWNDAGRPQVKAKHRLRHWSSLLGGVLQVAGFSEFLSNMEEATRQIDRQMQDLEALANIALKRPGYWSDEANNASVGRPAGEWGVPFKEAGAQQKELNDADGDHQRKILIGRFFSATASRSVPVADRERTGKATLCSRTKSRTKYHWFQVVWDDTCQNQRSGEKAEGEGLPAPATTDTALHASTLTEDKPKPGTESSPTNGAGNNLDWGED